MSTRIGDIQDLLMLFLDEDYQEIYDSSNDREGLSERSLERDFACEEFTVDGQIKVTQGNYYRNVFGKILRRFMLRDGRPVICKMTKLMAMPTYTYAEGKDIYRRTMMTNGRMNEVADVVWYTCPKIFLDTYPHMFRIAPQMDLGGSSCLVSMIKESRKIKQGGRLLSKFYEVFGHNNSRVLFTWLRKVFTGKQTNGIFIVITKYAREMSEAIHKILIPMYGIGGRVKAYNMINSKGLDVCYEWKDDCKYNDESVGIIVTCVKPDNLFDVSLICPVIAFTDSRVVNTEIKTDDSMRIGKKFGRVGNEITVIPDIELKREDPAFTTLGPGRAKSGDREKTYDARLETNVCITTEYIDTLTQSQDWDSDVLGLLAAIMNA